MGKQELIKSTSLKDVLATDQVKGRLKEILGQRAPQFAAALIQIANANWALRKCSPQSIIGSAVTAAALDLSVDPQLGEAHLVPYKETCTFQLGYIGLGQLAQRSGQYKRLGWTIVREGQLLEYDELSGDLKIDSTINPMGEVIGYACKFSLLNGFERAEYWPKERVMAHAERYSQSYRAGLRDDKKRESPWWTDPDRMGLKTVFKSLIRVWGPKSIQMKQAITTDEAAVDIEGQVMGYPDNEPTSEPVKPDFSDKPAVEVQAKVEEVKPAAPAPAPAPTPAPAAKAKPEKAKSEAYNYAKVIRALAKTKGVDEPELLAELAGLNVTDGHEKSLEELKPEVISMLNEQVNSICDSIVAQRKANAPAEPKEDNNHINGTENGGDQGTLL